MVTTRSHRPRSRSRAGYTLVEVMMSLAVFTIGVMGMIGMQKVTISSNQHAKNLALATHIAEAWLDELATEAAQWNTTGDFDETIWLVNVGSEDGPAGAWFRPTYSSARQFGAAFDPLGNAVATDATADDAHFCADVRLTWLYRQVGAKDGGGLIRAEVRVFWRRAGLLGIDDPPAHVCDVTTQAFDSDLGQSLYHVVYLSTALRQQLMDE
jgi:prepilin-type N-terminal cleavage/methylation domain-containing protein